MPLVKNSSWFWIRRWAVMAGDMGCQVSQGGIQKLERFVAENQQT